MSFEIQVSSFLDFQKVRLIDAHNGISVEIATKGALLNSWLVQKNQATRIQLIDGNDFNNGWDAYESSGFKSAKMAPFACRLENGEYPYHGKTWSMEKYYLGKHAIHGIVYDALYTIQSTQADTQGAVVVLKYHYHGQDKGYPFHFSLQIKWHLHPNNRLTAETIITNYANEVIPIMDGWHPYFTLGASIDECYLSFHNQGKIEFNEALLPTGSIIEDKTFNHPTKLNTTELDHCFLLEHNHPTCTLENEQMKLVVEAELNYPYLQLYTPPHRKSVAIENLSGVPNCFNNKMGLLLLKPHENLVFKTSYQVFFKS
jgi:aldose 1-epimerase